ncbi:hypothetical protein [Streptomyces sp. NPDC018947]|uniref:hypothetical protein n=1 Tax=Streptomyces sp. NPDC018947 TaxID=3365054 RepID=UPI0037945B99
MCATDFGGRTRAGREPARTAGRLPGVAGCLPHWRPGPAFPAYRPGCTTAPGRDGGRGPGRRRLRRIAVRDGAGAGS